MRTVIHYYSFCAFCHGEGVIDTNATSVQTVCPCQHSRGSR